MTEIRNCGTHDVLIAVVDGLKGFPEAINAVFPEALVQTCIVHLIRYSMQFASWKERKAIAAALRPIYGAESAAATATQLEAFDAGPWGENYPGHCAELAVQLGTGNPVFCLPDHGAPDHLHHQRDREPA